MADVDARHEEQTAGLCADLAAARSERDAARAALVGRADLEPRLRLALERRELGTVADKFVTEGVLDAAAAWRLTESDDADFQRFGPVADIRAAVREAFSADLVLEAGGDPPKELICPLSLDLFEDPVFAVDGHVYEREAIERWFRGRNAATSPLTNAPIATDLVPAHGVRSLASRYRDAEPPEEVAPVSEAPSRAPQTGLIRNARRKAQRDVREAEDTVAKHKAAADDARKARESADARAAAAVKDVASAERYARAGRRATARR